MSWILDLLIQLIVGFLFATTMIFVTLWVGTKLTENEPYINPFDPYGLRKKEIEEE